MRYVVEIYDIDSREPRSFSFCEEDKDAAEKMYELHTKITTVSSVELKAVREFTLKSFERGTFKQEVKP